MSRVGSYWNCWLRLRSLSSTSNFTKQLSPSQFFEWPGEANLGLFHIIVIWFYEFGFFTFLAMTRASQRQKALAIANAVGGFADLGFPITDLILGKWHVDCHISLGRADSLSDEIAEGIKDATAYIGSDLG